MAQSQTLRISNTGTATLNWSAAKTQAWLTLGTASGSIAAGAYTDVTVTADETGLASGSYADTITITDAAASNSPQSVPVTFNVTAAPAATAQIAMVV